MTRNANINWNTGSVDISITQAQLAVLMDIRDELQQLNRTLQCPNFQAIPQHLLSIREDARQLNKRVKKKIKL